ncbi:glycosyltransferase family 4 protein [Altererythrobacter lutimaris]|uniref:Glycosyltransferase family 4 protein n=1 Tax=Altererythrobacter lutimaris TaxID=2743979 RepID=A0A850HB67_9SPHN|nr:glycosyltransferase family 4 protein [Altererythrobacter lutimaris]NVE94495.1 glycosyltransferase family 4 protein [Altererythrobacter lutimaris]
MSKKVLRILHCLGGREALAAELLPDRLARLGRNLYHEFVGVSDEDWHSVSVMTNKLKLLFPQEFPSLEGKPTPGRLLRLANAIKPYDLVLTYGWGAIDVAMAHTLFSDALGLPPLIHHETALAGEEKRLSRKRSWYRRVALGKAAGLVVPSERLEEAALVDWQQPIGRVKHFAPGVEIPAKPKRPKADALRGIIKREGELWIGCELATPADVAARAGLIASLAQLPDSWHLVVLTNGLEADGITDAAAQADVSHRVHAVDSKQTSAEVMGLFDIWIALTDGSDEVRNALIAMALEKPVLASQNSGIAALLPEEFSREVATGMTEKSITQALSAVTKDDLLRVRLGAANREQAKKHYNAEQALDRYRRLYASAMKAEITA